MNQLGRKLTAHQLRHGYTAILLEADISIKDDHNLLEHSDASTTQNIYQEISQTRKYRSKSSLLI